MKEITWAVIYDILLSAAKSSTSTWLHPSRGTGYLGRYIPFGRPSENLLLRMKFSLLFPCLPQHVKIKNLCHEIEARRVVSGVMVVHYMGCLFC